MRLAGQLCLVLHLAFSVGRNRWRADGTRRPDCARGDPARTTGCIIGGTFGVEFGAAVVFPDEEQAEAVGADARKDARLQGGCRDGSG